MEKGRIVQRGSVHIERRSSGTIAVWWPGWVIECSHPTAGVVVDLPGEIGPKLEGDPLMLGVGGGANLVIGNDDGHAEQTLASMLIGGYSIDELRELAAGE